MKLCGGHCQYRKSASTKCWVVFNTVFTLCFRTNVVRNAIDMSRSFQNGNFVRLCRLMKDMPPLLAALAALHLTEVRRRAFRTMSVAYHSKNLNFPLKILKVLLLYGSDGELIQDCKHYEIKTDTDCVYFTKDGFNHQKNPVSGDYNLI
mgnify:CR=1 FL=1